MEKPRAVGLGKGNVGPRMEIACLIKTMRMIVIKSSN
jgi:hypothetical protein